MNVVVYKCHQQCGWIRAYQENSDWLYQSLKHPIWGVISNKELVRLDILNHNCDAHHLARLRMGKLQQQWNERFSPSGRGPLARVTAYTASETPQPEE